MSLLTGFEDCEDYLDWEVGTHGIYIHLLNPAQAPKGFEDGTSSSSGSGSSTPAPQNRRRSGTNVLTATYLPDVIPEQGWTKKEAIDSAIRKAGWSGKITEDLRRGLRVRRYRSEKVERSWGEYVKWKEEKGL